MYKNYSEVYYFINQVKTKIKEFNSVAIYVCADELQGILLELLLLENCKLDLCDFEINYDYEYLISINHDKKDDIYHVEINKAYSKLYKKYASCDGFVMLQENVSCKCLLINSEQYNKLNYEIFSIE